MKTKNIKQRFKKEDIVENKSGWKRKIVTVVFDYLGDDGRIGYIYLSENYPALEFVYGGMCSQEHLLNWIRK